MKKAILALADGLVFEGTSFGAAGESAGEVVFNTSMTGYQEILTDPSYKGQIVTMTYTQIGNYGVNDEDVESAKPYVEGFIVKEYLDFPSNWRMKQSLHEYLKKHSIVGIQGIDTRALTRHLRDFGAQPGIISTTELNGENLVAKAKKLPKMSGLDLAKVVTCKEPYSWDEADWDLKTGYSRKSKTKFKVVAYDYGIKRNILRLLTQAGCDVTVVPAAMPAEEVLKMNPDGVFLSNGPAIPSRSLTPSRTSKRSSARSRSSYLPGTAAFGPRPRREDLQAQVRPPRREPADHGPDDAEGRDCSREPRFRCGHGDGEGPGRDDPHKPE